MAYELNRAEIKRQVAALVGHDGLSDKVNTWVDRVLASIGTRAFWQKQLAMTNYQPIVVTNTITSNFVTLTNATTPLIDAVNFYRMEHVKMNATNTAVTYRVQALARQGVRDIYNRFQAQSVTASGVRISNYAVVGAGTYSSGGVTTQFVYPSVVFYPQMRSTAVTDVVVEATYLKAIDKLSNDSSENWVINQYFTTVLSGVLRYVYMYLGDVQKYILEKQSFENGVDDMLRHEEATTGKTPVLRGIAPGNVGTI